MATDWHTRMLSAGRSEAPGVLYEAWASGVSIDELRDLVVEAWVTPESPVRVLGERTWLGLFREVGYVWRSYSDAPFPVDVSVPPAAPVVVWRGATVASKGRGMSWTLDQPRARWFAERLALYGFDDAAVYEATLPPRAVLAMFNDRAEQEVVVNPNMLRGRIHVVEVVDRPADAVPAYLIGGHCDHAVTSRASVG